MSIHKRYIISVPEPEAPDVLRMLHMADIMTEEYPENPGAVVLRHPEAGLLIADRAEAHWRMHRINACLAGQDITPALERQEYPDRDWSGQLTELAMVEFDWAEDDTPSARFEGGQAEWRGRIAHQYPAVFRPRAIRARRDGEVR